MLATLTVEDFAMIKSADFCDNLGLSPLHVVVLCATCAVISVLVSQKDDQVFDWYVESIRHFLFKLTHFIFLWIDADNLGRE